MPAPSGPPRSSPPSGRPGASAAAKAALDAFLALDHRIKDTVTAWQLRDADGQVVNDHTDADYDAAVLERLAAAPCRCARPG